MNSRLLYVVVASFLLFFGVAKEAVSTTTPPLAQTEEPAPTQLKVRDPMISFAAIRHITCGDGTGTGSIIKADLVLTAAHVVDANKTCIDSMTGAIGTVVVQDTPSDFAILKFPEGSLPERFIRMSCEGFKEGQTYYSYGWMFGQEFVVQRLLGTGYTAPVIFIDDGKQMLLNLQVVQGVIIPGMSGGPIVDADGNMVGTNQVTDYDGITNLGNLGGSRAVADTFFCQKPKLPEPAPKQAPKKK